MILGAFGTIPHGIKTLRRYWLIVARTVGARPLLKTVLIFPLLASCSPVFAATFNSSGAIVASSPSWSSSGATISQSTALSIAAPVGSPASMSQATAAVTAGGIAVASGVYAQQTPVTGQLALSLGLQLLGAGAAAAAGGPFGAALAVGQLASAGQTGAALYQAMSAKGISPVAGGGVAKSPVGYPPLNNIYSLTGSTSGAGTGYDFFGVLQSYFPSNSISDIGGGVFQRISTSSGSVLGTYTASNFLIPISSASYIPPVLSAPSNAELSAIMAAVVAPSNANFAAIAGDLSAFAIQNGANMNSLIAATDAAAATVSNAIRIGSPFTVQTSSVDALGNTSSQLMQNVLDIPAVSAGGSLAPVVSTNTVNVVNNTPQTITNTVNSSGTTNLISTPTVQPSATTDLCKTNPDALACSNDANLSDVPLEPLPIKDLSVSLTPVVFGGAGFCPAPVSVGGGKFFEFSGICTFLGMLKPLLLAFAWLTAGAVVFRGRPYA